MAAHLQPEIGAVEQDVFRLADEDARELADAYGTPLYVISEERLRETIRRYKAAFQEAVARCSSFPPPVLSYASKANGTLAVLHIAHQEGCLVDVASEGELRGAIRAGVPAQACEFHGNNKAEDEVRYALSQGVRTIVVDNFEELELLGSLWPPHGGTKVVLRLAPGVDPITHARIATGKEDTKFGFNISDGAAERALLRALELGLTVVGVHCHVGSQLLDPGAQIAGGEALARFAVRMKERHGFITEVLNLGGGLGIRYTPHDHPPKIEDYCDSLVAPVCKILAEVALHPVLMQEPGRALIGECCVTLYRVGVVKTVPVASGERTYICVDGGLGDNPRPALYGAEYTVLAVSNEGEAAKDQVRCTVSGRHCETDELFSNVKLPSNLRKGDLIQVLCTGAYNSSMANNYNRYPRPASVLVGKDGSRIVQRRESWDEIFSREEVPNQ